MRFQNKHGMARTPTYRSYQGMISRCTRPSSGSFDRYGALGVKVCDRWLESFENFLADMGERPEGTTLDRYPDKSGHYEPQNCRWATRAQQDRNRRSNRLITIDGITKCATDWATNAGLNVHTFLCRIDRYGMTPEKALNHVMWKKRTQSEMARHREVDHERDI